MILYYIVFYKECTVFNNFPLWWRRVQVIFVFPSFCMIQFPIQNLHFYSIFAIIPHPNVQSFTPSYLCPLRSLHIFFLFRHPHLHPNQAIFLSSLHTHLSIINFSLSYYISFSLDIDHPKSSPLLGSVSWLLSS